MNILNGYKNINENNHIYIAMQQYLNNLLKNNEEDEEIYSSYFIVNELKSMGLHKNKDNFYKLLKNIYINYNYIIRTINNIIKEISKNIESLPYSIKCIFKIIDILLNKKYDDNYSLLKKYIFKANFLIGNLIIPILQNPNFNGIIYNIISDIAKENLKQLSDVFEK